MREIEITVPVTEGLRADEVKKLVARKLGLSRNAVIKLVDPCRKNVAERFQPSVTCVITRRSLDARGEAVYRYRLAIYQAPEEYIPYQLAEYQDVHNAEPVIVVGSGPAGMFAALKLLTLGRRPIVLERGKDVHARKKDMAELSKNGKLNPDSNYCFGEGGAGTFSDGKLYTRSSKRGDNREVLYQLVRFGADPSILIDAHPHIGTDKLPYIVENIRHCIEEHGGEYRFETRVTDISEKGDEVLVTAVNGQEIKEFRASSVILATGHSARDIYELFINKGWELQRKGFALGVRVEHPQQVINKARYHGRFKEGMPAAEYAFVEQIDGRGVFSFCMCPGGILVPSSTEEGSVVLNGMSNSARNSRWANAGAVVQLEPEDVPEKYEADGALALLNWQRDIERAMFEAAQNSGAEHPFSAPAQRMVDFCKGKLSGDLPSSSYRPGAVSLPLHNILPREVSSRLQKAFPLVDKKIPGYFTNEALLLGVESRTSSPVRIPRDPQALCSVSSGRIFPCGEGAGYSGGIVSSAIDGIRCACACVNASCGEDASA